MGPQDSLVHFKIKISLSADMSTFFFILAGRITWRPRDSAAGDSAGDLYKLYPFSPIQQEPT